MSFLAEDNISMIINETEISCQSFKTGDSLKNKIFLETVKKNLELTKKLNEKLQFYHRNIDVLSKRIQILEKEKLMYKLQRLTGSDDDDERPRCPSPPVD